MKSSMCVRCTATTASWTCSTTTSLIGRRISPAALAENRDYTIWRYKPLLPVEPDSPVPPLTVGWTPLYRTDRLGAGLGLKHVWVKDEGRQPSASFKDRASVVAVVKAQERGAEVITTASTGNAGAALSAMCASVAQKNVIFLPESAPPAKVAQLLVYGSTVIMVRGTYDDAFELCAQAAKEFGWYNRNTGYNPYMSEGKKTVSFEICEQLGWDAPDRIFVSVGDGCIIGGVHKGLRDLMALGWINKMPKIMGVQAAGSAALYDAWRTGIERDGDAAHRRPHHRRQHLGRPARAIASRAWPPCVRPTAPTSKSPTTRSWPRSRRWRAAAVSSPNRPGPPPTPAWSKPSS